MRQNLTLRDDKGSQFFIGMDLLGPKFDFRAKWFHIFVLKTREREGEMEMESYIINFN